MQPAGAVHNCVRPPLQGKDLGQGQQTRIVQPIQGHIVLCY